jgi:hypothetical protein
MLLFKLLMYSIIISLCSYLTLCIKFLESDVSVIQHQILYLNYVELKVTIFQGEFVIIVENIISLKFSIFEMNFAVSMKYIIIHTQKCCIGKATVSIFSVNKPSLCLDVTLLLYFDIFVIFKPISFKFQRINIKLPFIIK